MRVDRARAGSGRMARRGRPRAVGVGIEHCAFSYLDGQICQRDRVHEGVSAEYQYRPSSTVLLKFSLSFLNLYSIQLKFYFSIS